ncbi:MAG TPA: hypothetical protein DD377_03785 [Firmicutes bacterium]|nr:hypothetical protein [Bacillota bacterium]
MKKRFISNVVLLSLLGGGIALSSCSEPSSSVVCMHASDVISLIDSLSDSSNKEEIEAARKAYDSLSSEEKGNIPASILNKLERLESILSSKAASQTVIDLIDSLNSSSTEEEINEAKAAYDSLNEEAKGFVTNLDKLLNALERIQSQKEAEMFSNKVNSIDLTTLTSETIKEIENAYENLSIEAKNLLDEATKEKYQQILVELDRQAALNFKNNIANSNVDTIEYDEIVTLRNEYESLSEKAKSFLDEATLTKYNQILENIDKVAKELANRIEELSSIEDVDLLFLAKKEEIKQLREKFSSLPAELKEKVTNINKLGELEKLIASFSLLLGGEDSPLRLKGDSEEYSYPTSFDVGFDQTYGTTLNLTLNQASQNYSLEVYFNNSIDNETLKSYDRLFFYFYNPGEVEVNMCLADTAWTRFGDSSSTYGKGWHKIEVDVSSILSSKPSAKIDTITSGWALFNPSVKEGWKITPIYGYKDNDKASLKTINSILSSLPSSLSGKTNQEKIQCISKLAYAKKLISSLAEEKKETVDMSKVDSFSSSYEKVGNVLYGINDNDTLNPFGSEENKEKIQSIDFDSSSSFASNYGQCFKINFKKSSPCSVYEFRLDNLSIDFSSYSYLCYSSMNDLCEWGGSSEGYGDYSYLIDDDIKLDLAANKQKYGLPGFYVDDGLGKGISFFEYQIDKEQESNQFKIPRFVYQNSWSSTVNSYLYLSPLVGLK